LGDFFESSGHTGFKNEYLLPSICSNNVFSFNPDSFSCSSFLPPEVDQPRMRAQALADHDADTKDELSLMAYEVRKSCF
jgi:hypothetical protein